MVRVPGWLGSLSSVSRWFRWPVYALTLIVSLALVVTMAPMPQAAAEPPPAVEPADEDRERDPKQGEWLEPTGAGLVRPDWVSASLTARMTGKRVEVLSERTESGRTWALPSGEAKQELSGVVRFQDPAKQDDQGGWRDIDTTLVKRADGSVSPTAVPGSLVLSGGGDSDELVKITDQAGRSVSLGAGFSDVRLPAPVLDGATATYPDVLAGVDARVEVRRTGFELLWVVKDAAGATALAETNSTADEVQISAPLTLDKTSARLGKDGSITLTSLKGKATGSFAAPSMWDATADLLSGPTAREPVRFGLAASGKDLSPADPPTSGKLALTVSADRSWLTSPDRVFPIMIDPTYESGSSTVSFDTYVKTGDTGDRSGSVALRLGKLGTTGSVSRTFLNVETGALLGRTVMSGTLQLWSTYAATCTPTAWSAYNAGPASTSTRWTSQPTIGTKYATSTATTGFGSGCAPGPVTIDMTSQLQNWAAGSATAQGLMLSADDESSADGYKIFSSAEGDHPPVLTWTANRTPDVPAAPVVADAVSYTPAGSSTAYLYSSARKPTLSVSVSDPDANQVTATFQASTSSNFASIASSCTSPVVASSGVATCALGTELVADGRYYLRTRSTDTLGAWGDWSPTRELRIAAVTPAAPVVSCPSPYTHGSWQTTVPGAPVTCTITATGTGYSAPSRITVAPLTAVRYIPTTR